MKKKLILSTLVLIFQFSFCFSQEIIGLWEIKKVEAGDHLRKPIAKWTKINEDGSYQSGTGWVQSSEGKWNYDEDFKTFLPTETNGIKDEFGNFTVSFDKGNMIWKRKENSELVTVTLKRIEKMPKSTADKLVGIWDAAEITENGESITEKLDPKNKHFIFIRWDRVYVETTPKGEKSTGYWYINGQHPEITLTSLSKGDDPETWRISVTDTELKMKGISDTNKAREITYQRLNQLPK